MYVRCDDSSHGIPGLNYVHSPDGVSWGNRIIKTMHTGFSAYTYCALCQRPGADTEETGRYDLAERLRSECSVNSNELSKV